MLQAAVTVQDTSAAKRHPSGAPAGAVVPCGRRRQAAGRFGAHMLPLCHCRMLSLPSLSIACR